jgi:hypothetical protein
MLHIALRMRASCPLHAACLALREPGSSWKPLGLPDAAVSQSPGFQAERGGQQQQQQHEQHGNAAANSPGAPVHPPAAPAISSNCSSSRGSAPGAGQQQGHAGAVTC